MLHHSLFRRRGKLYNCLKTLKKFQVIGYDRRDLGLLQHDLGQPDAISIAGVLPRQIMPTMLLLPANDARSEAGIHGKTTQARDFRLDLAATRGNFLLALLLAPPVAFLATLLTAFFGAFFGAFLGAFFGTFFTAVTSCAGFDTP